MSPEKRVQIQDVIMGDALAGVSRTEIFERHPEYTRRQISGALLNLKKREKISSEDAKYIPRKHTEEEKEYMRGLFSGKKRPEVAVNQTEKEWIDSVYPLLLRVASEFEISDLTDIDKRKITRSIHRRSRTVYTVPDYYFSEENKKARHNRSATRANNTRWGKEASLEDRVTLAIAKKLVASKIFGTNLDNWNKAKEILTENDVVANFNEQLILEAYVNAREKADKGDSSSLLSLEKMRLQAIREEEAMKKISYEMEQAQKTKEEAERISKPLAARGVGLKDIENLVFNTIPNADLFESENHLHFARRLIGEGFIGMDMRYLDFGKQLAETYGKDWFSNPYSLVVTEAYIRARVEEAHGNRDKMIQYFKLGREIDKEWFEGEQLALSRNFIKYKVTSLQNPF